MEFAVGSCRHECRTFCKRGQIACLTIAHGDTLRPRAHAHAPHVALARTENLRARKIQMRKCDFPERKTERRTLLPPPTSPHLRWRLPHQLPHTCAHESKFSDGMSASHYLTAVCVLCSASARPGFVFYVTDSSRTVDLSVTSRRHKQNTVIV